MSWRKELPNLDLEDWSRLKNKNWGVVQSHRIGWNNEGSEMWKWRKGVYKNKRKPFTFQLDLYQSSFVGANTLFNI